MVRFINEIILKYLLGISKCTKLPGKENKKTEQKQYLRTNTSLHIRHIYILEIILATFSLKFVIIIINFFFNLGKKKFPSSVLKSTTVGFWTSPALRNVTQRVGFPFR